MRNYITVVCLALMPLCISAQISGVSASKISSLNASGIAKELAEFEPSISYTSSSTYWDNDGDLSSIYSTRDSVQINTTISLRMAYAMTDLFEVGTFMNEYGSSWSMKYLVYNQKQLSLGLMGGVYLPFGNAIVDKRNRQPGQVVNAGIGVIGSYQFNDEASIDVNMQIQEYLQDVEGTSNHDIFMSIDYGHYFSNHTMQIIGSFAYQSSSLDVDNSNALYFTPGFSFEMKPEYLIVINGSFGLFGKNTTKSNGFGVAWTMTL